MILLSWDQFLMDYNERFRYEKALTVTQDLMKRMIDHFPREHKKKTEESEGSHGWHIVKFHVMPMMVSNCLKFGSAKVCHGSAGEKNHKWFVKRMAAQTQMRLDLFASQVAISQKSLKKEL